MNRHISETQEAIYSEFRDDEDFIELIEMFTGSMPEKVDLMRKSFSENNIPQLQTYAHQLKGAGAGYGFSGISEVSEELEKSCKLGDPVAIASNLEIVLNYLSRVTV